MGFGAGEKDLSSKGLFHRPNSLNLFTDLCRKKVLLAAAAALASEADMDTFSGKSLR